MKKLVAFAALVLAVALVRPLVAQEKHDRVSPHATVSADIGGDHISITYGRPYTKDPKSGKPRKIWGELVPLDKVWRMGADEATQLTTAQPIEFGGQHIPAGTYSLFMLPRGDKGASLIVNKQTGEWGTKYDQAEDLVRVDMKPEAVGTPIDQFTIALDKTPDGSGVLRAMWEGRQYSVPIKVVKE